MLNRAFTTTTTHLLLQTSFSSSFSNRHGIRVVLNNPSTIHAVFDKEDTNKFMKIHKQKGHNTKKKDNERERERYLFATIFETTEIFQFFSKKKNRFVRSYVSNLINTFYHYPNCI